MTDHTLADLKPDPRNARRHNPRNVGMIEAALSEVGTARSIVVDEDGTVLAGNGVYEAAVQAGISKVQIVDADGETLIAVRRSGLTDAQKQRLALFDNRAAELADWNADVLAALVDEDETALQGMFSDDELNALLASIAPEVEPADDPGAQVDRAEELREQWQVERGQLWEIPSLSVPGKSHRLLCGDSTSAEDVVRFMGGDRAEMVWTDPPYGVAVGDKNKWLNSIAPSNRVEENLTNDTASEAVLMQMLVDTFDAAIAHCEPGAAWYVAAPPGPLHVLFGQVLKDRGIWRQTIAWVKNNATFSPMGVSYHWAFEPIFYGWLPNGGHRYYGDRKQTTVWEIDRPQKSTEHPTMKPVELVTRAIEHSSRTGEIAYDPFLGSGTTMVAAEQTGRVCFGCDIAEKYVAVALERMSGLGLEPLLVGQV